MQQGYKGYIGLYRCLLDKPIWKNSTPEHKTILITLLLMANHDENEWEWEGKKFKVKPGQKVTSLEEIRKASGKGITTQNVRSALVRFKKLEFLTDEPTKTGRLITILNWELYQIELMHTNKETNKEVTKHQQRGNKEVTPNNNDNNDNNDKKYKYTSDSIEFRLSSYLFKWMQKNNPKAKEPNYQTWSKAFDKILRIDERDLEEVKAVIKWCQTDNFWHKNILSPGTLRDKYDRLLLEMKEGQGNGKYNGDNQQDEGQQQYDFSQYEH